MTHVSTQSNILFYYLYYNFVIDLYIRLMGRCRFFVFNRSNHGNDYFSNAGKEIIKSTENYVAQFWHHLLEAHIFYSTLERQAFYRKGLYDETLGLLGQAHLLLKNLIAQNSFQGGVNRRK